MLMVRPRGARDTRRMFFDAIPQSFVISGVFLLGGIVKGLLGLGLPTVAMGLLGLMMPVAQAASLLTLPSLLTNVWQGFMGGRARPILRRLATMQAAIVAGVVCAAWLPPHSDDAARALLGACLLAYGITGLAGWRPREMPPSWQRWAGPIAGMTTGVVTGVTGVFVLPAVPYLQSLRLDRNELTQALGISFSTSTIALGVLLARTGELDGASSMQSAFALVPALGGMFIGQQVRRAMSERVFRACFFGGLAALGAWLALPVGF